jgi:hypothetical protein
MVMITGFIPQDTIKPILVIRINTENLLPDSVFQKLDEVPAFIRYADSLRLKKRLSPAYPEVIITDTTSVSSRNNIADITFYDSTSFVRNPEPYTQGQFPFQIAEITESPYREQTVTIIKPLKEGLVIPEKPFPHDWMTILIILSSFLWLVVKMNTRSMFPEFTRFFLFRGINESSSRDTGSLFYWQSTVMNFVSFLIIGMFIFCAAAYYDFIPKGMPPFLFMLISLGMVIFSVTSRHLICVGAGSLSSETEAFNEYLMTVYQSHRFSSVLIFAIIVILLYTVILPPRLCFTSGAIVLIIFYLYRVTRLLLIFMRRNISILYLILYLCALEILPVLIMLKYFTGLI